MQKSNQQTTRSFRRRGLALLLSVFLITGSALGAGIGALAADDGVLALPGGTPKEVERFQIRVTNPQEAPRTSLAIPEGLVLESWEAEGEGAEASYGGDAALTVSGGAICGFTAAAGDYSLRLISLGYEPEDPQAAGTAAGEQVAALDFTVEPAETPAPPQEEREFGVFGANPLAKFDGLDLSGVNDVKTYATDTNMAGHESFAATARMLQAVAEFQSASTGRSIEITIAKGLMFDTLPGFSTPDSGLTWSYNNSLLPTEQQSAVTGATFTPETITTSNVTDRSTKAGTVTYTVSSDPTVNVTELRLAPTVKYNEEFMINTDASKTLPDAVTVTTRENGGVIESQTLESIVVQGAARQYAWNSVSIKTVEADMNFQTTWALGLYRTGYLRNAPDTTGVSYYLPEAEFTITVPKGVTYNGISFSTAAGSAFSGTGSAAVTSVTGNSSDDGGTKITVKLTDIYVDAGKTKNITLDLTVDNPAPAAGTYVTVGSLKLKDADDAALKDVSGSFNTVSLVVPSPGTVPLLIGKSAISVGYVPDSLIDAGEGTLLGAFSLRNAGAQILPLYTVRLDFPAAPAEVLPRIVHIPVANATTGAVPHLTAHVRSTSSSSERVISETNMTAGRYAPVSLLCYAVFAPVLSPDEYMDWIEYEVENLPADYGSSGANGYSNQVITGVYGAFAGRPADNETKITAVASPGAISAVHGINTNYGTWSGDWTSPQIPSKDVSVPVADPNVNLQVTGTSAAAGSVPVFANGETFMAGNTYTRAAGIRIPQSVYFSASSPYTGTATYVRGLDIYLRGMGALTIDADSIQVRQNTEAIVVDGVTAVGVFAQVPASDITVLQDNAGGTVYKVHLPDAILSRGGAGAAKYGGTSRSLSLQYSFTVRRDAVTAEHSFQDLIWAYPLYDDDQGHAIGTAPYIKGVRSVYLPYNNKNRYDVANDGTTGWLYGTLPATSNFVVQAQSNFMAATSARLLAGNSAGDWKTGIYDALKLTPFGEIQYRFHAQNNSGKDVGSYVAHIPVPKAGEGAGSGFESDPGQPAQFEWTAVLTGPVVPPAGVDPSKITVLYSPLYVPDTNGALTSFEAWNPANAASYRTVRIEHTEPISDGGSHDYILPLKAGGTHEQQLAWTNTGAVNFYSSFLSFNLNSVAHTNDNSEPVAALLSSGIVVGRVYRDNDRNGVFGAGDVPLEGVQVLPVVTGGPTYAANGNAAKVLPAVSTDANGYYQVVLADGDVVSLEISNPLSGTKMLRFYGDTSVRNTKTLTGVEATSIETDLKGGATGLIPPYFIQWNDNLTPSGGNADFSAYAVYRYGNEAVFSGEIAPALSTPPTATLTGSHFFSRWYSNQSGTGGFEPAGWYGGDVTFYALRDFYTATFYTNDGTGDIFDVQSPLAPGAGLTNPGAPAGTTPFYLDHEFTGWYRGSDQGGAIWDFHSDTVNSNINLFAGWTPKVFTLLFDPNGGANDGADANYNVVTGIISRHLTGSGNTLGGNMPRSPERAGYIFDGWFDTLAAAGGAAFTASTPVTDSGTVYARWTPKNYTVKYDVNGATSGPIADKTNVVWTDTGLLPHTPPARDGYTFIGWDVTAGGSKTGVTNYDSYAELAEHNEATASVTLRAQWSAAGKYIVRYDGNDATGGTMADDSVYHGENYSIPANAFTRSGHTFTGWEASGDKTGAYADRATLLNVTGDVTLTAQWRRNGGGGGSVTPVVTPPSTDPGGGTTDPGGSGNDNSNGGTDVPDAPDSPTVPDNASSADRPAPGGHDPGTPPVPAVAGSSLVPGDDGSFIEIGEDGVPLGAWHWDDPLQEWVFEEYPPPLASLPQTGATAASGAFFLLAFLLLAAGCSLMAVRLRRQGRHYKA
ncbi:MAG: InlB B-repeat-containing protein [Clostridiales Family XIII bacterium]|nr:InlB B-repeat-containing protein [Clostridiales Family XIII bacterium]